MANNNDFVVFNLDRPRVLRLGHKALKMYQAMSGRKVDEFMSNGLDFEEMEQLAFCGLLKDAQNNGETLTLEKVEDLLDEYSDMQTTMEILSDALSKSFEKKGNSVEPGKKQSSKKK